MNVELILKTKLRYFLEFETISHLSKFEKCLDLAIQSCNYKKIMSKIYH